MCLLAQENMIFEWLQKWEKMEMSTSCKIKLPCVTSIGRNQSPERESDTEGCAALLVLESERSLPNSKWNVSFTRIHFLPWVLGRE